jgi:NAD+ kinase
MKKAAFIPNKTKDPDLKVTARAAAILAEVGIEVIVEDVYAGMIDGVKFQKDFPIDADVLIVVGGDGSVIDASKYSIEYGMPLVGINLGKVGYLSEIEPDGLDALRRIATGDYRIENKMLLTVSVSKNDGAAISDRYAVNDVVVSHDEYLGIADLLVSNSSGDSIKYRADGVIVSTPAGSSAYSLSAGGPLVSHALDSVIVTPVCPHSFFNRSLIFSPDERISVSNVGECDMNVSLDGRLLVKLGHGERVEIKRGDKTFPTIALTENRMFETLFKKIKLLEKIT